MNEALKYAYDTIRETAECKHTECRLKNGFWTRQGYMRTENYKKAVEQLKKDGFKVEFFYEEHQFVDMYTIVSWGPES